MKKNISDDVRSSFQKKGILYDRALLTVSTDMGREEYYCDADTVLTEEGIASLFSLRATVRREGAHFLSRNKTEFLFREMDWFFLPIEEIESIKVEEQISLLRLVARRRDGTEQPLFWAGPKCRKELFRFCEEVNAYLENGTLPEREERAMGREMCCPNCHTPYADPERKLCKKCAGKGNLVKKLMPFFLRYRWQMVLVFVTVFLSGIISVITPYLNSRVLYDRVLKEGDSLYGKVLLLVFSIAFAAFLGAVVSMINTMIGSRVAAYVSYDIKKTIFSAFERLSFSFFTSRHTGRLITQINSDAETLYWFFCDGVPYFLTNVLQMLVIGIVMLSIHPLLTAVIIVPIPLLFFGYWFVLRMFRRLHAENHTRRSRFNSVLSDVLGGMRVVKAFSREEAEIQRFDDRSTALSASKLNIDIRHHTIFPILNLGMRLTSYVVWGLGGWFVLQTAVGKSGISYGVLNLFISYLTMLYNPLNFFANFFTQMANGLNALQRLFEILDARPEVEEKADAVSPEALRGEISFNHVNFSYAPGKKTIQDVSFHVPAGKTLGIVGHTGAGKSTLANLLTRLYDVESGSITIDGIDLRDLSFATLRSHIAIVSQETYLFRGTIMDNIRYASPEADEEEVLAASIAAGCHDFIMSFPNGYDTRVGMNQKMLSGGEKQRISIARAILKNPTILILDEATSAMDTRTERRIQEALSMITKNRTTITIAHRLSTLRDADSLIVIENGKVVEEGTHESLLKKEGVYHKLYTLQIEAMKTIGVEE